MFLKNEERFDKANMIYNTIQSNNLILNPIQHLYKDRQFIFLESHRVSLDR